MRATWNLSGNKTKLTFLIVITFLTSSSIIVNAKQIFGDYDG